MSVSRSDIHCSWKTFRQQNHDARPTNPWRHLKIARPQLTNETTPITVSSPQPEQWRPQKWELFLLYPVLLSQDSVDIINLMTRLSARQLAVHISLFCKTCGLTLRPTQLPIQWATGMLSPEILWLLHETDQSPSTSDEVREQQRFTSLPTCLPGEHRNNCTSLYYYVPVMTEGLG